MKLYVLVILLLAMTSLAGCATTVVTSGKVAIHDENVVVGTVFTGRDRQLIHRYYQSYRHRPGKTSPGLAKRGDDLAHGLAKRDRLPPGLRMRGLPEDLEFNLTKLPKEYVRVIVGGDVVILKRSTRVVIDIYRDVVVE